MSKWQAYGKNIIVEPASKNKIIGNDDKYYLYGKVLAVGSEVSPEIKVGDTIGYTRWGFDKIVMADGAEHFFVQDNSDFILGILHDESSVLPE